MIEYVKVQLLELAFSEFQRSSELNKLACPAAFRKVAHVFHKRVPWHCQLPVQQNRGLACQIVRVVLRRAVQREHSRRGPLGRQWARPCYLQARIVSAARYASTSPCNSPP